MKTEIIVIADESGSMASIHDSVCAAYASFIEEQRLVPGEARLTLYTFNDRVKMLYQGAPIADAKPLVLCPNSTTAMYDGLGLALEWQGKRIHDEKWAELVIVVVLTDGWENASRLYTRGRIRAMVRHAEAHGWKFVFLAANLEAGMVASSVGSSTQFLNSYTASAAGANRTMAYASTSVTGLRAAC